MSPRPLSSAVLAALLLAACREPASDRTVQRLKAEQERLAQGGQPGGPARPTAEPDPLAEAAAEQAPPRELTRPFSEPVTVGPLTLSVRRAEVSQTVRASNSSVSTAERFVKLVLTAGATVRTPLNLAQAQLVRGAERAAIAGDLQRLAQGSPLETAIEPGVNQDLVVYFEAPPSMIGPGLKIVLPTGEKAIRTARAMTSPDETKRIPLRIRLPFSTESEFIEKYGAHLAPGGIFITTRSSKPEGTALSLEVVLSDGTRVMRGEGVVEQVVEDPQPGRSGMLVRFTRIDARTRALLDLVSAAREGVVPEPPAVPASAPAPTPPPPRISSPTPAPQVRKSKPPLGEDVVLGIDLGTTTCRVAVMQDGHPKLLPIPSERGVAMPSVVALDPSKARLLVGSAARKHRVEHPEQTIVGFKRLMGRRARSKQVKEITGRVAFPIVPDMEGDVGVELGGRTYALPDFAALLLKELKNAAQEALHREVYRAVLCVPAWYTDHQRAAVLEAGRLAGLEILSLLNEPSAIALAFGFGRGLARKRVLVYDLGGGTFDASVVEITGDDIEVVSTGGDIFLGGMDFDARLAEALIGTLEPSIRDRLLASRITQERVRDAAELVKISLSEKSEVPVRVPFVSQDDAGRPVDLKVTVERGFLEGNTRDLLERTVEVTQVVLEAAKLTPAHLDEVLMVGGQSRAPAIRSRLEAVLGRTTRSDVDPQGAVALGAALFGHSLVQRERGKRGLALSEVLAAPIGVAVRGGGVHRVLERNTRLPAEKTLTVPVEAGQTLALAVVQGTAAHASDNEYLGALHATFDRAGDAALRFSLSTDGRLTVTAASSTGKLTQLTFATPDASEALHAELLAQSPLPGGASPVASSESGLIRGLKRLFGK